MAISLLVSMLVGCGGDGVPFTCPEKTELNRVDPRHGGRTAWCARRNGSRHGPWMEWHEDGTVSKSSHFFNNRRSGLHELWFPGGQKLEESTYAEGKLHGKRTLWHPDGTVKASEQWEEGRLVADPGP